MTDLIARLAAAEGPSRELDHAIFEAIGLPPAFFGRTVEKWWLGSDGHWNCITYDGALHCQAVTSPHYTGSLDAALTLVPDGMVWRVEPAQPVYNDWGKYRAGVTAWDKPYDLPCYGATPALALCIAAFKARVAS